MFNAFIANVMQEKFSEIKSILCRSSAWFGWNSLKIGCSVYYIPNLMVQKILLMKFIFVSAIKTNSFFKLAKFMKQNGLLLPVENGAFCKFYIVIARYRWIWIQSTIDCTWHNSICIGMTFLNFSWDTILHECLALKIVYLDLICKYKCKIQWKRLLIFRTG